jgi:hypothetical protein
MLSRITFYQRSDGLAKKPDAALRVVTRRFAVSKKDASLLARLACGILTKP